MIIRALIYTLIIELLVLYLQKEKNYKVFILAFLINTITNVSLNITLTLIDNKLYYVILIIMEIGAFIIEALAYFFIYKDFKKALRVSLLCNLASYLVGLGLPY